MKKEKVFKIVGISLASIVGVAVLAIAILMYVIFSPKQLTPVVKKVADNYITCDYELGAVDLTFFSTFPEFGLRADGILIVNPTEGAQSDTLLYAKKVVARVDLVSLLKDGNLDIHEVSLQDVALNVYIAEDGHTNFDIIKLSEDTVKKDKDTTKTESSFIKSITMDDLCVSFNASTITFVDEKDSIWATLYEPIVSLNATQGQDSTEFKGNLNVSLPSLSAKLQEEQYAADANIKMELPFVIKLEMPTFMDIQKAALTLNNAKLSVNEFQLSANGDVAVIPEIDTNIDIKTGKWHISDFLEICPPSIFTMPEGMNADGYLKVAAHVEGIYNDSLWPMIDAHIDLTDATGSMDDIPYLLTDVNADLDAHIDLMEEKNTQAIVNAFSAKTKKSSCTATGAVYDLLNDMLIDLNFNINLNLPDAAYFLPNDVTVHNGKAKGDLHIKGLFDDIADLQLAKGLVSGQFHFVDLYADMDSIFVKSPSGDLAFNIPNSKPAGTDKKTKERRNKMGFLDGTLSVPELIVTEDGSLKANLGKSDFALQINDILESTDIIFADLTVNTSALDATVTMKDSLGNPTIAQVNAQTPNVRAYVEYDFNDTIGVPTLDCTFAMAKLDADYDTINAHVTNPSGSASITGGRRDKSQPRLNAKIKADNLNAVMGTFAQAKVGKFSLEAAAQHTNDTSNILLEWRPKLRLDLNNAIARIDEFEPEIKVPRIKFSYTNKECVIDTSRFEIGHSNFSLSGNIKGIGAWLREKDYLTGDLYFTSSYADINELMAYVSNLGGEEEEEEETAEEAKTQTTETATAEASTSTPDPFMVPERMKVTLHTNIAKADAFGQQITNLGGNIYVCEDTYKNPQLIIEQVGFICDAANLQLSAMYKTPSKKDIFAGFDYHMMDVDIQKLVEMIPQVKEYVPMLDNFYGNVDFQLAGETRCNGNYDIKPSTTRAACSIVGTNLEIDDNSTFQKIAKLLSFARTDDFKIDSISTEINMYKNRVEIYPLLLTYRNWKAAVGGEHIVTNTNDLSNVQMSADYHVSLLSPVYLGVDVNGPMDNLNIKLSKKVYYAKDFSPIRHKDVDTASANIRAMIKDALNKALKEE